MEFLTLLKKGQHTAILSYVKSCKCLCIEEEVALIERGNHEEIMSYIKGHWLEVDGWYAFLKRGKLNEMRFYLSQHWIYEGEEANVLALGRGIINPFVDYVIKEQCLWQEDGTRGRGKKWIEEMQCLIVDFADHCAIRRYIYEFPLFVKAYRKLQALGNAEDMLVHDLLWNKPE